MKVNTWNILPPTLPASFKADQCSSTWRTVTELRQRPSRQRAQRIIPALYRCTVPPLSIQFVRQISSNKRLVFLNIPSNSFPQTKQKFICVNFQSSFLNFWYFSYFLATPVPDIQQAWKRWYLHRIDCPVKLLRPCRSLQSRSALTIRGQEDTLFTRCDPTSTLLYFYFITY